MSVIERIIRISDGNSTNTLDQLAQAMQAVQDFNKHRYGLKPRHALVSRLLDLASRLPVISDMGAGTVFIGPFITTLNLFSRARGLPGCVTDGPEVL